MDELSKVISLKEYKKKRRINHLKRAVYSAAKVLSIAFIAFLLVRVISDPDHSLVKGYIEAKVDLMEYSD